ncbi:hypothetical protein U91I_02739 [alpha proteobacterium U9-1i]|nr:hypothetical protein U91I_02739 [alpha proteobacterium U9-1i]
MKLEFDRPTRIVALMPMEVGGRQRHFLTIPFGRMSKRSSRLSEPILRAANNLEWLRG